MEIDHWIKVKISIGSASKLCGGRGPGNGVLEGNTLPQNKGKEVAPVSEPPFSTWSRIFPGLDPSNVFFPKKNKARVRF